MAADLTLVAVPNLPYAMEMAGVASRMVMLDPVTLHIDGVHGPDGTIIHESFDYTEDRDSDKAWDVANWVIDWPGYDFLNVAPYRFFHDGDPWYKAESKSYPSIASAFPPLMPTVLTRKMVADIMVAINVPRQRGFRREWVGAWNADYHTFKHDPEHDGPKRHTPKETRKFGRRRWAKRGDTRVKKPQQIKRWLLAHVGDIVWTETW